MKKLTILITMLCLLLASCGEQAKPAESSAPEAESSETASDPAPVTPFAVTVEYLGTERPTGMTVYTATGGANMQYYAVTTTQSFSDGEIGFFLGIKLDENGNLLYEYNTGVPLSRIMAGRTFCIAAPELAMPWGIAFTDAEGNKRHFLLVDRTVQVTELTDFLYAPTAAEVSFSVTQVPWEQRAGKEFWEVLPGEGAVTGYCITPNSPIEVVWLCTVVPDGEGHDFRHVCRPDYADTNTPLYIDAPTPKEDFTWGLEFKASDDSRRYFAAFLKEDGSLELIELTSKAH